MLSKINLFSVVLFLVLLLAFLLRIINLNYNSPFLDEAMYILLGKKFFDGRILEVAASTPWVGGSPFFYSLFSSIFFSVGGIFGSRFFNVILGTSCVWLIYLLTKKLYLLGQEQSNRIASLVAAAFMATAAIPIAFSRLAIYDTLCVTIFLVGLITLAEAIFEGERHWYIASSVIFFFSFLAKYVVAIFFPFLFFLTIWLAARTKDREKIIGIAKDFCGPLIVLIFLYALLNFSSLRDFIIMSQSPEKKAPLGEIFANFWRYTSLYYLLSLGGVILLWRKKRGFIAAILGAVSFLPLIFHFLTGNNLSVHQHSVFSLIFILPLVGVFFAFIIQRYQKVGTLVTCTVIFFTLILSIPKANALGSFWPNTNKAIGILKSQVLRQDRVLAEAADVFELGLYDKLPPDNMVGPYYFLYKDKKELPAYLAAIGDGYFNFIELDETAFQPNQITEIEKSMKKKYSIIFNEGKIRIFRLKT